MGLRKIGIVGVGHGFTAMVSHVLAERIMLEKEILRFDDHEPPLLLIPGTEPAAQNKDKNMLLYSPADIHARIPVPIVLTAQLAVPAELKRNNNSANNRGRVHSGSPKEFGQNYRNKKRK